MIFAQLCHLVDFFGGHTWRCLTRGRALNVDKVVGQQSDKRFGFGEFNLGDGNKAGLTKCLAAHPAIGKGLTRFADQIALAAKANPT